MLRLRLRLSVFLASLLFNVGFCDTGIHAGDDLYRFVSRPDLMPPKWRVSYYDKPSIAPGYWFLSSFNLMNHHVTEVMWSTCQFGPLIYDNEGELVWSGGCMFDNRVVFNFEPTEYQGRPALKGILSHAKFPDSDTGAIFIMNQRYEIIKGMALQNGNESRQVNLHEFNVLSSGKTALVATRAPTEHSAKALGLTGNISIESNGFQEINMITGRVLFNWTCEDHIGLDESTFNVTSTGLIDPKAYDYDHCWDAFHINSVDKNEDGNYLISLRHTDSFMLISGVDGHIIWRCGGKKNDFTMENGLVMSRMHHPRWLNYTQERSVISLLDNAAGALEIDLQAPTNNYSRGLILELDHAPGQPFRARMVAHYDRPDGELSRQRGSLQILPNENVFMAWTDAGYLSEHAKSGEVLMEARWYNDHRLNSYRSHKFSWIGRPVDPPDVKAIGYSTGHGQAVTAIYVSWNGATEHRIWKFYSDGVYLGMRNRTGFETAFVTDGPTGKIQAMAFDRNGKFLGRSEEVHTEYPRGWGMRPNRGTSFTRFWTHPFVVGIVTIAATVGFYVLIASAKRHWYPMRRRAREMYHRGQKYEGILPRISED